MAKTIPITEHFQHFLAEMKESFGGICTGRHSKRGNSFSSCSRSGNGIAIQAGGGTNGGRADGESIATGYYGGRTLNLLPPIPLIV